MKQYKKKLLKDFEFKNIEIKINIKQFQASIHIFLEKSQLMLLTKP